MLTWAGFPGNVRHLADEVELVTGPIAVERDQSVCQDAVLDTEINHGRLRLTILHPDRLTPHAAVHELLHAHRRYVRRIPYCTYKGLQFRDNTDAEMSDLKLGPLHMENELEHLNVFAEQRAFGFKEFSEGSPRAEHVRQIFDDIERIQPGIPRRLVSAMSWATVAMFAPKLRAHAAGALLNAGLWETCELYWRVAKKNVGNKVLLVEATCHAAGIPLRNIEMVYLRRKDDGLWQEGRIPLEAARPNPSSAGGHSDA